MLRLINVTLKPINIKERKGEILAKGGQVFANTLEGVMMNMNTLKLKFLKEHSEMR